jgi:hypothetical protein
MVRRIDPRYCSGTTELISALAKNDEMIDTHCKKILEQFQ